jgi:PhzF family phenazine biosynthesis protein
MTRSYVFHQVDVFASEALMGNPLAVVHAADDWTDAQMAALARWTHLSETAFLLRPSDPDADYRVRIFTPAGELPFAGHPTLGSCAAWLAAGGSPREEGRIVQQCGIGAVRLRAWGSRLAFDAPPLQRDGALEDAVIERISRALAVPRQAFIASQWLVNGPAWATVMLRSREEVLALQVPDAAALGELKLGVVGPARTPADGDIAFEVRAFAPGLGVPEDPVTGSLHAGIARWLIDQGLAPPRYVAAQGTAMGRAGRVHVQREGASLWIGGDVRLCIQGSLHLDDLPV